MCHLKLSCHSNNLIKAPLLGALTCIPTVGRMSFIMGLNSLKSQSTVDSQKSEIANLRNSQRSMNMNTISNGSEKCGFCPHHLPFPEKHHQYFSLLGPWFASSWQFLFPPHHPSNHGFRCSSFITPTYRATASDLFNPIFSSSHTKVLPQQVPTHIPWGWICSFPYSTIHKVLSLVSTLTKGVSKCTLQALERFADVQSCLDTILVTSVTQQLHRDWIY